MDPLHIYACERFYFERHTGNVETTLNIAGMMSTWLSTYYFRLLIIKEHTENWGWK